MTIRARTGVSGRGTPRVPVASGTSATFANLLWVNALAPSPGTGSVAEPFPTPAAALAAVPSGASATIVLAPADYSATPALSIADRDINLICLGGAITGTKTPRARAVLPAVTFAASAATMQFYASQCVFGTVTVSDAVNAVLENCSVTLFVDAGNLAVVRANGGPESFGGSPQETINGSIGTSVFYGIGVQSLSGQNFTGSRGRVLAGGTGVVMSVSAGCYDHEFDASTIFQGPGIFIDSWSLFQAVENAVNLGVAPKLSVQELPAFILNWGALNYNNNLWLNPFLKSASAAASAALEWIAAPRDCYATAMHLQTAAAVGADVTMTLHQATTVAGLAAAPTALACTLVNPALFADSGLSPFATTPVFCARGSFLAVRATTGGAVVANSLEAQVTLL